MIVCLTELGGDERYIEDAAAVVRGISGCVRICRDRQADEFIGDDVSVVVVNS